MQRTGRWVGHAVAALAFLAFLALGFWQFERAQSATGTFQNLGYALQWPLFAVFAVLAWRRVIALERRRTDEAVKAAERTGDAEERPVPVAAPRPQPAGDEETDDELAAYNAFLARLAARDALQD